MTIYKEALTLSVLENKFSFRIRQDAVILNTIAALLLVHLKHSCKNLFKSKIQRKTTEEHAYPLTNEKDPCILKIIFVSAYFSSIFKMQMIFEIIIVCCANELNSFSCRMNINLTNSFSAKVFS